MATTVIFRRWANGDVIALFPEIPASNDGRLCQSYEHIGQHAAADPVVVTCATTPAAPEEYGGLLNELIERGYVDLQIRQKLTRRMNSDRKCRSALAQ